MRQTGVGGGRNCGLVIALGLGLAAGPARDSAADSISYSTDRSISYTVPLSSVTQPGLVPFFDPTPGSLEAVAITASGTVGEEIDPAGLSQNRPPPGVDGGQFPSERVQSWAS
jgi:hypothetical protein